MPDSRIFICYRRNDAGERAHRLHDSLATHFGDAEVFIDLDLPAGQAVRRYITDKLNSCVVLLVVIGPDWLTATDEQGARRLDNELDWVRLEIATALRHNIAIVPLLVQNAPMPAAADLPPDIQELAELNALQLSDGSNWRHNVNDLIVTIERIPRRSARRHARRGALSLLDRMVHATPRQRVAAALATVAAVCAVVLLLPEGDAPLVVYSSLPQNEQQQSDRISLSGSDRDLGVVASKRTVDVEDAIELALAENGHKAGEFDVVYKRLDASDRHGLTPPSVVQANARRAAADEHAAVYIGDFNSGSTQESIPILSLAKLAQISPASTRVGLTKTDKIGDYDEPARYYPPQPGYAHGVRNFVRIVPPDDVQARALSALLRHDGCRHVAMVDDGSAYGAALAKDIRYVGGVKFVFSESVGPFGSYKYFVDLAKRRHADCFVYSGSRNPNTVPLFEAFAKEVPKLYGTDGEVAASFYDPSENGLPSSLDGRVSIMVPPRAKARYKGFVASFERAYPGRVPDPYAVYGYEAMRLALDAIKNSKTGKRDDIIAALSTATASAEDSPIGAYTIRDGDTDLDHYDVAKIKRGVLHPRPAPRLTHKRRGAGAT